MAENYVEIKIKASDTAKPDLTALRADLDELGAKVETAKVDVDDKDSAATLLALNAKLAQLNRQVASPRITVAGAARAEASIAAVDASLEKLNERTEEFKEKAKEAAEHAKELADKAKELGDKAEESGEKVGGLGRALGKLSELGAGGGGGGGLLSRILYGAEGVEGDSEGLTNVTGLLGKLGPSLLAIVPAIEAGTVEATGLVSGFAAAGAGAGAFALLAMPAFGKVKTALSSISTDQKAYDDALTKTAKNTALKKLQQDYKSLSPDEAGAVKGIQSLQSEFGKISKAFEPQAFKVFNDALKIANNLLPVVAPLANSFANALDGLLKKVDKFTSSKGFKDWLSQFEKLSGPSVTAIGNGIGKVAVQVGKLLTVMSKKDVVHAINIAFDILAGAIEGVAWVVHNLMRNWDEMSSAFRRTRHDIASAGHDIASVFDTVRHAAANMAHNLASYFDEARANVHRWADDLGHDVDEAVDWFRKLPGRIWSAISGLASGLSQRAGEAMSKFEAKVESGGKTAINWFKSLPGKIVSALGDLGHLLVSAGESIIRGLISGIENAVPGLHSALSWVSSLIPSWKGPPAKDAQLLYGNGQLIMQGLTGGIRAGLPSLHSTLDTVTNSIRVGAGTGGVAGAAGTGGTQRIQLEITGGDDPIIRAFRQSIRVRGGNVQTVLGAGR